MVKKAKQPKKQPAKKQPAKKKPAKKKPATSKKPASKRGTLAAQPSQSAAPEFPFLFRNHGPLLLESFGKASGAYIGFTKAPTGAQITEIMKSCPEPIRGFVAATDTLLSTESFGDVFDWTMLERYGTEADKAASLASGRAEFEQDSADRFSADVERWALAAHQIVPITFLIGPGSSTGHDAWDNWTIERLAEVMLPFVQDHVKRNRPGDDDDRGDPASVGRITRTHVACLLQEFDPGQGLPIPKPLVERIKRLRKAFPL